MRCVRASLLPAPHTNDFGGGGGPARHIFDHLTLFATTYDHLTLP
jgi:hypothetical protein